MLQSVGRRMSHEHLRVKQEKDRLNSFFEEIVTKAAVDFSNPEIQDIQSAVSEMLERIKTRINERGFFTISRLEPCGSMAEKTAMWKYDDDSDSEQPFIELDFLAVLQAACDFKTDCQECCRVKTPPMNLEKREKYYDRGSISLDRRSIFLGRRIISIERRTIAYCFIRETNEFLASCRCLEVEYEETQHGRTYTFKPASTCSENQPGCNKCTVERPTGTLRVKTSERIGGKFSCSLVFVWTSKAKTLCTRDIWGLPQTEKMDTLTIHIDFLPALELFQCKQQSADVSDCSSSGLVLNPTSSKYVHDCFLVPKQCYICERYKYINKDCTWRRSGCLAEIDTIVNQMSDKHRKCYKMIKYIYGKYLLKKIEMHSYHIKIAVLHHNRSCSDASEDCATCVFKVLDELQHACETKQLTSFRSQSNLLEYNDGRNFNYDFRAISNVKKAVCSAASESNSVSSFIVNIDNHL